MLNTLDLTHLHSCRLFTLSLMLQCIVLLLPLLLLPFLLRRCVFCKIFSVSKCKQMKGMIALTASATYWMLDVCWWTQQSHRRRFGFIAREALQHVVTLFLLRVIVLCRYLLTRLPMNFRSECGQVEHQMGFRLKFEHILLVITCLK